MKRFALPLSLAVLVFAQACTDSLSPDRHASMSPTNPTLAGNVPPPPTKTIIVISVASTLLVGEFTGVYFASGGNSLSVAAAAELADAALGWNGTAWLRLDNTQTLGSTASANARFQVTRGLSTDPNYSGRGTLKMREYFYPYTEHTVTIDEVWRFEPNPDCFPGTLCATINFHASIDGISGHEGTAQAFDSEYCDYVNIPGEEASVYVCPSGSEG